MKCPGCHAEVQLGNRKTVAGYSMNIFLLTEPDEIERHHGPVQVSESGVRAAMLCGVERSPDCEGGVDERV